MINRKIINAQNFVHRSVARVLAKKRSGRTFQISREGSFSSGIDKGNRQSTHFLRSPLVLFAREILNNPRAMGAACPSSRQLAKVMAQCVSLQKKGLVVELGAGTGKVTEALLLRGLTPDRLIIIERSPVLADYLKKRFPLLHVIQGDALELSALLGDKGAQVSTIVSGLPLRSLPKEVVQGIVNQVDTLLGKEGLFIQFTYNLRGSAPHLPSHFKRVTSKIVWNNLPPARVDVYQTEHVLSSNTTA